MNSLGYIYLQSSPPPIPPPPPPGLPIDSSIWLLLILGILYGALKIGIPLKEKKMNCIKDLKK